MIRKFIWGFVAALVGLTTGAVIAAQVDSSEYIMPWGQAARSDGMYQRADSNGLDWHINGYRLNSATKAVYEDFSEYGDGDDWCMQADWSGCSTTDTETNLVGFPSGNKIAVMNILTNDTGVDMDAGSLDISGEQTDDDGLELAWGTHGATGAPFTVGTDPAFYACATFVIADASGVDDFHFGFRVVHDGDTDYGFNKVYDDYHDVAAIGILGNNNPGKIYITTAAADGGMTETDTSSTWVDGAEHRLCTYVSGAGVATYTFDNLEPPTTASYTFTDAESLVSFIHLVQHGDLTEELDLLEWEVGYGAAPF